MSHATDISYLNLALGYLLMVVPIVTFTYFKTGLLKTSIISIVRMTVQLLLVGVYLEFIFKLNNLWVNIAWVLVMILVTTDSIIKRSELSLKIFAIPVLTGLLGSITIIDAFFLGAVVRLDNIFDAGYFIPITGMLLGNCLSTNIMAMNSFYNRLVKEQVLYRYYLASGASRNEALAPFMREALKKAFNPILATTAVVGLISLPGMMTGQILGGSSPNVAIKYQIMLMLTIFVTSMLTVLITIFISNHFVFDEYDNLKQIKK